MTRRPSVLWRAAAAPRFRTRETRGPAKKGSPLSLPSTLAFAEPRLAVAVFTHDVGRPVE